MNEKPEKFLIILAVVVLAGGAAGLSYYVYDSFVYE